MPRSRVPRDRRSYGFLCGRSFSGHQKAKNFWRLRRQDCAWFKSIEQDQACPNVFRAESAVCRLDRILGSSEYAKALYPAEFSRTGLGSKPVAFRTVNVTG